MPRGHHRVELIRLMSRGKIPIPIKIRLLNESKWIAKQTKKKLRKLEENFSLTERILLRKFSLRSKHNFLVKKSKYCKLLVLILTCLILREKLFFNGRRKKTDNNYLSTSKINTRDIYFPPTKNKTRQEKKKIFENWS